MQTVSLPLLTALSRTAWAQTFSLRTCEVVRATAGVVEVECVGEATEAQLADVMLVGLVGQSSNSCLFKFTVSTQHMAEAEGAVVSMWQD